MTQSKEFKSTDSVMVEEKQIKNNLNENPEIVMKVEKEERKKRNFTITLSAASCKSLSIKAGLVGITVDELLYNFIEDLVDGTYCANGYCDCDCLTEWYNFRWNKNNQQNSLLSFLLNSSLVSPYSFKYYTCAIEENIIDVDYLVECYEEIQKLNGLIAVAREFPEYCKFDIKDLQEDLVGFLKDFHDIIDDFLEEHPFVNIDDEIEICRKWLKEYEEITQTE